MTNEGGKYFPYIGNNETSSSKSKRSISTMFNEALKSVNDISDLIPPPTESSAVPSFQFPFMPYPTGAPLHNPNDMFRIIPSYQKMQQVGFPENQMANVGANNFTLGPSYQYNTKALPEQHEHKAELVKFQEEEPVKPVYNRKQPAPPKLKNQEESSPPARQKRRVRESPQKKNIIEAIQIKHTEKTFEQLLEEKLASTSNKNSTSEKSSNTSKPVAKRAYLKRKSMNVKAEPVKKYSYYADKFNKQDSSEEVKKITPRKPPNINKGKGKEVKKNETQLNNDSERRENRLVIADSTLGPNNQQNVKEQLLAANIEHTPQKHSSNNSHSKPKDSSFINTEEHKEDYHDEDVELNLDNEEEKSGEGSIDADLKDPKDILCNDSPQEANPELENKLKVMF